MQDSMCIKLTIPTDLDFADLRLTRDRLTGALRFSWETIARICAANGVDVAIFRDGPDDNLASLIVEWYAKHLAHGGAGDPCADDLLQEVQAQDDRGGGFSHPPGHA
jgi:hypothetical protein